MKAAGMHRLYMKFISSEAVINLPVKLTVLPSFTQFYPVLPSFTIFTVLDLVNVENRLGHKSSHMSWFCHTHAASVGSHIGFLAMSQIAHCQT